MSEKQGRRPRKQRKKNRATPSLSTKATEALNFLGENFDVLKAFIQIVNPESKSVTVSASGASGAKTEGQALLPALLVQSNKLPDMPLGGHGFCVPWAVEVDKKRQCFLKQGHDYGAVPRGTVSMLVERDLEGNYRVAFDSKDDCDFSLASHCQGIPVREIKYYDPMLHRFSETQVMAWLDKHRPHQVETATSELLHGTPLKRSDVTSGKLLLHMLNTHPSLFLEARLQLYRMHRMIDQLTQKLDVTLTQEEVERLDTDCETLLESLMARATQQVQEQVERCWFLAPSRFHEPSPPLKERLQ